MISPAYTIASCVLGFCLGAVPSLNWLGPVSECEDEGCLHTISVTETPAAAGGCDSLDVTFLDLGTSSNPLGCECVQLVCTEIDAGSECVFDGQVVVGTTQAGFSVRAGAQCANGPAGTVASAALTYTQLCAAAEEPLETFSVTINDKRCLFPGAPAICNISIEYGCTSCDGRACP